LIFSKLVAVAGYWLRLCFLASLREMWVNVCSFWLFPFDFWLSNGF